MAILSPIPFLSCCFFPRLPSLAYPLALTCPLNSDLFAQALYTRKLERLRVWYPCFLPPPVAPPSSPPAFALASPRSSTSLLALQVLFCSVHGLGNPERHTDGRGVLVYMSFTFCRPLPRLLLPSSPLSQPGMLRSSFGHQGGRLEGGVKGWLLKVRVGPSPPHGCSQYEYGKASSLLYTRLKQLPNDVVKESHVDSLRVVGATGHAIHHG